MVCYHANHVYWQYDCSIGVLFSNFLCPSLFDLFPPAGLAHLKAEQGILFFVFLERWCSVFMFTHHLAWCWGISFRCVAFSTCPCALVVAAEKGGASMAAWLHGMFLISPMSVSFYRLSVSSPWLHPGFCVLHKCALFSSGPQLTRSDAPLLLLDLCSDRVREGRQWEAGGWGRKWLELGETVRRKKTMKGSEDGEGRTWSNKCPS